MKYTGLRLASYLSEERGRYARLADAMAKYRGDRKNASDKKYNLAPLLHDGHNITIKILDGLMKETGKPLDFFIDFGPIGAAFIVIGSSFVFIKLTEVSSITSFSKILLICLYTKVLLMGYTYWSYLTAPLEPVVAIVLSILFNISLPPKKIES